jgi:hypothetical protein
LLHCHGNMMPVTEQPRSNLVQNFDMTTICAKFPAKQDARHAG